MKNTIIALVIVLIIGGIFLFSRGSSQNNTNTSSANFTPVDVNNVSVVDGKQIVEINVKGGYRPQTSTAKAGMPTVIRFNTNGTFDCSVSVRIPSMNISKILPQSGNTDIDIGNSQLGTLQGTCGMGMYRFQVNFQG